MQRIAMCTNSFRVVESCGEFLLLNNTVRRGALARANYCIPGFRPIVYYLRYNIDTFGNLNYKHQFLFDCLMPINKIIRDLIAGKDSPCYRNRMFNRGRKR